MESACGGVEFSVDIGELMSLLPEFDDRLEFAAKTVSPLTFLGVAALPGLLMKSLATNLSIQLMDQLLKLK